MHSLNSSRFELGGEDFVGEVLRGGDRPVTGAQIDKGNTLMLIEAEEIGFNSKMKPASGEEEGDETVLGEYAPTACQVQGGWLV